MSLMDFSDTLEAFASPLPIYVDDSTGQYIAGEWVWGPLVRRMVEVAPGVFEPKRIRAVALMLGPETLFYYAHGNASSGGLALLTQEELFFSDVDAAGERNVQSFVEYQGLKFRVNGDGFTSGPALAGNANFRCYHCLRYVE